MEYEGWRDVHVGFEGDDLKIGGVGIWDADWRRTGLEAVQLPHPAHQHQRHRFDVYEVGEEKHPIRFAAGELSNGVWGFYVPV
jgi:hypothetical protein